MFTPPAWQIFIIAIFQISSKVFAFLTSASAPAVGYSRNVLSAWIHSSRKMGMFFPQKTVRSVRRHVFYAIGFRYSTAFTRGGYDLMKEGGLRMTWVAPEMTSGNGARFTKCYYRSCGTIYTHEYSGSTQCSSVSSSPKS